MATLRDSFRDLLSNIHWHLYCINFSVRKMIFVLMQRMVVSHEKN